MKKPTRNYILFIVLALLGLFEAVSGFVLRPVLPEGRGIGEAEVKD